MDIRRSTHAVVHGHVAHRLRSGSISDDVRRRHTACHVEASCLERCSTFQLPSTTHEEKNHKQGMPAQYLGHLLFHLQANIDHERSAPCTWEQRRQAFSEYESDVKFLLNGTIRLLRKTAWTMWTSAPHHIKDSWHHMRTIRSQLYQEVHITHRAFGENRQRIPYPTNVIIPVKPAVSGDVPPMPPVVAKGTGVLRTFNTFWHNELADLGSIVSQDVSVHEKVRLLQGLPELQERFAHYVHAVQALAKRLGFAAWGCCMEVSLHGNVPGRVHLHDFMGPAVGFWGWDEKRCAAEITESELRYAGLRAHTVVSAIRGNNQRAHRNAAVSGMYYVTCNKIGSFFHRGVDVSFPGPTCLKHGTHSLQDVSHDTL